MAPVAIVSVCLNDLAGLQRTWESVRSQSQLPARWIVVDADSSDGTREWLRRIDWAPLCWTSEPDGGIYDGMNKGLRRCESEYVLFLNSGDVLADDGVLQAVANALAAAVDPPVLLFGDCYEVDRRGIHHMRRARPAWWVPVGMPTCHQAMYFRRDAIPDGFDTHYRLHADYAAVGALYARHSGNDFQRMPAALCRFQLGGRSDQQRSLLLREASEIRQRVLGMNALSVAALHALHALHGSVKQYVPALHRFVRYS